MGLAPFGKGHQRSQVGHTPDRFFIHGNIHDDTLNAEEARNAMKVDPQLSFEKGENDPEARVQQKSFAYQLQHDVEDIIVNFITWLVSYTGVSHIAFAGGVALNSCANSRINELDCVSSLYVPPYPGDEGISVGCATFGETLLRICHEVKNSSQKAMRPLMLGRMPFLGRTYTNNDVARAVKCFAPWVTWSEGDGAEEVALALSNGAIVGWFDGPSEFGPRALGHRSFLADPRKVALRTRMNKNVKKREAFRPFAPAIMREFWVDWIENGEDAKACRYMGMTRKVIEEKANIIGAVVHVDGSARAQCVCTDNEDELLEVGAFARVLKRFHELTGVGVILNTSFNVAGEPIVESPFDAIRTLVRTDAVDIVGFENGSVRRIAFRAMRLDDEVASGCTWIRVSTLSGGYGTDVKAYVEWEPIFASERDDREKYEESDESHPRSMHEVDDSEGLWVERADLLDGLEISILERVHAFQQCSVQMIVDGFYDDDDIVAQDVLDRLDDLHSKLLVYRPS